VTHIRYKLVYIENILKPKTTHNKALTIIIIILFVIIGVAYLTILERKILKYLQFCKGSNKIAFLGLLQLFSDELKLLRKMFLFIKLIIIFIIFVLH